MYLVSVATYVKSQYETARTHKTNNIVIEYSNYGIGWKMHQLHRNTFQYIIIYAPPSGRGGAQCDRCSGASIVMLNYYTISKLSLALVVGNITFCKVF